MKSSKSKPRRIFKSQKFGLKNIRPMWIEIESPNNLWFSFEHKQWRTYEEFGNKGYSNCYYAMRHIRGLHDVYSIKAVKRLISKWDLPKGSKISVSLPITGHEFILTKK